MVPPGKRAVIKHASTVNSSAAAQQAVLYVATVPVWVSSLPANTGASAPGMMIVAYATEQVKVAHTATGQVTVISGYLLDAS